MILEHAGFVVSFNPTSVTLRAGVSHHEFIGMNMDTEKTVDKNRIRISKTTEEDDPDKCMAMLHEIDVSQCIIRGVYYYKNMLIVSMQTQWEYTNPRTRIISARHVFYMVFNRLPEPRATLLAILDGLDTLYCQTKAKTA